MIYIKRELTLKKRRFIEDLFIDYLAGRISKESIKLKYKKKFNRQDGSFYSIWDLITVDTFYNNFRTTITDFSVKEEDLKGLHQMPKNWKLLKHKDDLTIADFK